MARQVKPSPSRIRVLVIDDEPVVRKGIGLLLARHPEFELCTSTPNTRAALAEVRLQQPHLVILDVRLETGTRLVSSLRRQFPDLSILVFSMPCGEDFVRAALRAGADAYVCREQGTERLLQQIQRLGIAAALNSGRARCPQRAGATGETSGGTRLSGLLRKGVTRSS